MADESADWRELTSDEVYRRMSADELAALANVQLQPGEYLATSQGQEVTASDGSKFMLSPPVVTVVDDTVKETARELRASIMAGGYAVDDDPKIPRILEGYVLSVIPFKLWSRLGGKMVDLEGSRKILFDRAVEVFGRIERGEYDAIPKAGGEDDAPQQEEVMVKTSTKLSL